MLTRTRRAIRTRERISIAHDKRYILIKRRSVSKAKKQHWVPRFYLKEFSIDKPQTKKETQVWIFSKKEGAPKIVNIKDIAVKRYLYSPKDEDGNRCWKMEEELASLEGLISQIWPTLAHGYLDLSNQSYKKIISLFLATLYLRHPKRLPEQEKIQNWLIDFYDKNIPKDKNGNRVSCQFSTPKGDFILEQSNWEDYSNSTQYDKEKFFVDTIKESSMKIVEIFMKKRWSVICSDKKQFITTDNPLIIYNRIFGEVKNYGLNTMGTTIIFPISPTRVLVLDDMLDEPHSQYYPLQDEGTDINLLSWVNAHQFMISHRNPDEVNEEIVRYAEEKGILQVRGDQ